MLCVYFSGTIIKYRMRRIVTNVTHSTNVYSQSPDLL